MTQAAKTDIAAEHQKLCEGPTCHRVVGRRRRDKLGQRAQRCRGQAQHRRRRVEARVNCAVIAVGTGDCNCSRDHGLLHGAALRP